MKVFTLLLSFFTTLLVYGTAINYKNGNFFTSFTDLVVPGGEQDLEITRTYNSKSTYEGWFGFGYGSMYETNLKTSADGSVTIYENGAGATTRFVPKDAVNVEAASLRIVEAMKKKETMSESAVKTLVERLKNSAEDREIYTQKYGVEAKIADGVMLYSNDRGMQTVEKIKEGFKRSYSDGRFDLFNQQGKLTKMVYKSGYAISFDYTGSQLTTIKDTTGKNIALTWYPEGRVKTAMSGADKKMAEYFYDTRGNLIKSKDVADNVYLFDYDNNHNMTLITYADKTSVKIAYTKESLAKELIERNGDYTRYTYESNPKNPELHYWTIVKKKVGSAPESVSRFEYEMKLKPDGQQYTYRVATELDGIKSETIYSECCSLPLKITRGSDVTTFEYNPKGLLTKKTSTKGEFVQLDYDDKINKITKVVNNDGWTTFAYDKAGNLSKAVNSQGKSVLLIYDRNGKISRMMDQDGANEKSRRTLSFKYNTLGKPAEIEMEGVGIINVAYDNYGEIKKVESKTGATMALQVTQAFQTLLSIVKPAGVNLNM